MCRVETHDRVRGVVECYHRRDLHRPFDTEEAFAPGFVIVERRISWLDAERLSLLDWEACFLGERC